MMKKCQHEICNVTIKTCILCRTAYHFIKGITKPNFIILWTNFKHISKDCFINSKKLVWFLLQQHLQRILHTLIHSIRNCFKWTISWQNSLPRNRIMHYITMTMFTRCSQSTGTWRYIFFMMKKIYHVRWLWIKVNIQKIYIERPIRYFAYMPSSSYTG